MNAKQTFQILFDKNGNRISGDSKIADKIIIINTGEEVDRKLDSGLVHDLLLHNSDFLELKYSDGLISLTPEEEKKYDFHPRGEIKSEVKKEEVVLKHEDKPKIRRKKRG